MQFLHIKCIFCFRYFDFLPAFKSRFGEKSEIKCVLIHDFSYFLNLPVLTRHTRTAAIPADQNVILHSQLTSRFREMLHSGSAIWQPLQHPSTPSLLLEHALQLRAETARSETLPSPPAGPHSLASRRPQRRGQGGRGALRTARSGVGLLPGLFLSGSSALQQAARR